MVREECWFVVLKVLKVPVSVECLDIVEPPNMDTLGPAILTFREKLCFL